MRRLMRVVAAILCGMGAPVPALALGLDLLAGGASIASGNGVFTFDDFEVIATGSVSSDLSLYDVSALDDGFALTGPISAADGESGDLFLRFSVTSSAPIHSVRLVFNGAASGTGSSSSVVETADDVSDDQAFVFATGGGGLQLTDTLQLSGQTTLALTKDILVDSEQPGDLAAISRVEQHFGTEVPEPAALLLLGLGLVAVLSGRARP